MMGKLVRGAHILRVIFLLLFLVTRTSSDFQKDVLEEHNKFRDVHGIPSLKIDEELTKKAATLAKKASSTGNLTKPQPGENTYMVCTSYNRAVTAKEAVEAWYDEVCNDLFSFEYPNDDNAHAFTQAMWKDSMRIGVARSTATDVGSDGLKCTFIIALYRPPGNIELTGSQDKDELFKENVFKGNFNYSYCDKFNTDDSRRRHTIAEENKEGKTKAEKEEVAAQVNDGSGLETRYIDDDDKDDDCNILHRMYRPPYSLLCREETST